MNPIERSGHDKNQIRQQVWSELRAVAFPDSRFHWNFGEFIPDFEGSEQCAAAIRQLDPYRQSHRLFITPDNSLTLLRQYALEDRKDLIVSTYGIARGFVRLGPGMVPVGQEKLAATLDGMEYFAQPISLEELQLTGHLDLLITGAAVITMEGIRWGKGHGFFDLEWGMFQEIGIVNAETPVLAVVHDCQAVDLALEPTAYDTIVDWLVTPTRIQRMPPVHLKPPGIFWDRVGPDLYEQIPPLKSLYEARSRLTE
jgi:5-formyltetrahydrofolate cyclo-ligase